MQYIGERLLNTITCQAPQLCISNVPSISHFSTNSISSWCLTLTQSPCANAMPLLLRIINEKCPQVTRRHWQSAKAGSVFSRRRFMGEAKQSGGKKMKCGLLGREWYRRMWGDVMWGIARKREKEKNRDCCWETRRKKGEHKSHVGVLK